MSLSRAAALWGAACFAAGFAVRANADDDTVKETLPSVNVSAHSEKQSKPAFPATAATIEAEDIETKINAIDVEDAVKYLPSLFVRKRNYGDTQPVLATRNWGVGSSARSLVYIDDIPISALIANNNTLGAPRWGVISPEQIGSVTMLYGPYSAAYSGNAIGGVLTIRTRTPDKPETTFEQAFASQSFDLYGTHADYPTSQTGATFGGRSGAFSWFVGANVQNSFSQPLSFVTSTGVPTGTSGTIPANNKLGQPANVLGASGVLHTLMQNASVKLGYDFAEHLHATYLLGYFNNATTSRVQSYLSDASGAATYAKTAGFASGNYQLAEEHLMQALSLASDSGGVWDFDAAVTYYDYLRDRQRSPAGVGTGTQFSANGRLADLGGTNWATVDAKAIWRPRGAEQEIAFGVHADEYTLKNPTWNTSQWQNAGSATSLFSAGNGKTRTQALWLQDDWKFASDWLATLGLRYERWRASDGFNFSGGVGVQQPTSSASAWSPKASLNWRVSERWRLTASLAKAVRFPTVAELYQIVSTGTTFVNPNPNLRPERVLSGELAAERVFDAGSLRVSLFQEDAHSALIAQTTTLPGVAVPVSFVQNVDKLRNRGVEFVAERHDALIEGLDLSGSVTFVDSTILSNPGFVSTAGTTSAGKHAPNVPRWRASAVATYRPDTHWNFTLAGRYSGKQYSTLDNTDNTANVYGAFDKFLVFDARVLYRVDDHLSLALGVDNLNNEKYFLFHPFPQRTYVADIKLKF